jgi:hypothetical protein
MTMVLIAVAAWASTVTFEAQRYRGERVALVLTAAADVITTRIAIRNGAQEGNPLLTPIVGKTPSTLKLVAVKAAAIGIIEWSASYWRKRGHPKIASAIYQISALSWGYAAGFNLRFVFK